MADRIESCSRAPISAKLVADLITTAGRQPGFIYGSARRSDSGILQYSVDIFCQTGITGLHEENYTDNTVVVSPDTGVWSVPDLSGKSWERVWLLLIREGRPQRS